MGLCLEFEFQTLGGEPKWLRSKSDHRVRLTEINAGRESDFESDDTP